MILNEGQNQPEKDAAMQKLNLSGLHDHEISLLRKNANNLLQTFAEMSDVIPGNDDRTSSMESDSNEVTEIEETTVDVDFGNRRSFIRELEQMTPAGTPAIPSMILEIGGGKIARSYDPIELKRKNIIIGNVDLFPEWGDRQLQCNLDELQDGLNDSQLINLMENTSLGTVVISHVIKFLNPDTFKKIVQTALTRLSKGGKFVVLDMNINTVLAENMRKTLNQMGQEPTEHDFDLYGFLYSRILEAFQYLSALGNEQREHFRVQHFELGAAVSGKITRKIYNRKFNPKDINAAIIEGQAVLVKHPIDSNEGHNEIMLGNKVLFPMFAERVIEVEKIDHEKESQRKQMQNRQQREQRRKEKEKRKQSRKRR